MVSRYNFQIDDFNIQHLTHLFLKIFGKWWANFQVWLHIGTLYDNFNICVNFSDIFQQSCNFCPKLCDTFPVELKFSLADPTGGLDLGLNNFCIYPKIFINGIIFAIFLNDNCVIFGKCWANFQVWLHIGTLYDILTQSCNFCPKLCDTFPVELKFSLANPTRGSDLSQFLLNLLHGI